MSFPEYSSSAAHEVVGLCEMAGLFLDPFQKLILEHGLGERPNGKWAAFEVAMVMPRQNGKGSVLEALELGGLFVLGERMIIHSSHQFDTSLEAFRRLLFLVENTPELSRRVKRVSRAHGEEGIELMNGQRVRFRTRTKGGGRGFTGDRMIFDEAMIMPEMTLGALLPTLSARPNPQVVYAASAVDQTIHENGIVLARVRERGVRGDDPSLAYFEWSVDARDEDGVPLSPDHVPEEVSGDAGVWEQANPSLGIRIAASHIEAERRSMDPRTFAVERLGVGDWPATDGTASVVIGLDEWDGLVDVASVPLDPVCLSFDVAPDRSMTSISASGVREDGLRHVEIVDRRRGTGWVVDRLVDLNESHSPVAIVCDGSGPAATLIPALEERGVEPLVVTAKDYTRACGLIYDLVEEAGLRHLGTPEMRGALRGAAKRPLGDAWAWSRKNSSVDITPLVAATLSLWGMDVAVVEPEPLLAVAFA
jgi:hypothetical protein